METHCDPLIWYALDRFTSRTQLTVLLVLRTIQDKLNNPSADDPFEPDIAAVSRERCQSMPAASTTAFTLQLLKNDEAKFLATAREWTKK